MRPGSQIYNSQVKDLDIFLPFGSCFETPEEWTEVDTVVMSDAGDTPIISTTVYTIEDFPLPVNIIIAAVETDIAGLISRFDFAACKIAHDGCNVYLTMGAVMDLLNRRITMEVRLDDERFTRSMVRAERFRIKYAGTDVVVDTTEAEFEHTL